MAEKRKKPHLSYAFIGEHLHGGINRQWRQYHLEMAEVYNRSDFEKISDIHHKIASRIFSKTALRAALSELQTEIAAP